jgi:hypothetical protein
MSSMSEERKRRIKGFIGGYLFESGLLTLEQLDSALERQLELIVQGRALRLGEVLVEMGVITRGQLEQAKTRQWTDEAEARAAGEGGDEQTGSGV